MTYRNTSVDEKVCSNQPISHVIVRLHLWCSGELNSSGDEEWLGVREANLEQSRNHRHHYGAKEGSEPSAKESTRGGFIGHWLKKAVSIKFASLSMCRIVAQTFLPCL